MTQIKICGVMDSVTAAAAVAAGTDYIGFVLAPSRRQLTVQQAQAIRQTIPAAVLVIGVFVSPTTAEVLTAVATIGLDGVQIHGDVPPLETLTVPLIKAVPLNELQHVHSDPFVLVDSPQPGSGTVIDWTQLQAQRRKGLWLAGGLTAANVGMAIEHVQPEVVDVSSGVETNGKKDRHKIKQFIDAVRLKGGTNHDL